MSTWRNVLGRAARKIRHAIAHFLLFKELVRPECAIFGSDCIRPLVRIQQGQRRRAVLTLSETVVADVGCNAVEPCFQRGSIFQLAEILLDAEERLLGEIVGEARIANQA